MSHLLVALLSCVGFAGLALSTERQQEELTGRAWPAARTRAAQAAGWAGLVAASAVAIIDAGWSLGLVSYSGPTSVAAGAVVGGLILARRRRRRP